MQPETLLELLPLSSIKHFHFIDPACSCHNCVVVLGAETARVNVRHFVFVFNRLPWYCLLLLEFPKIPNLDLVLSCVTAHQQLIVRIVDRVASHMWAVKGLDAFADSGVPLVNDWVPSSWDKGVFINELDTENPVAMSTIIPLCAHKSGADAFGVLIISRVTFVINPDMRIPASSCKVFATGREVDAMNWVLLFLDGEKFFHGGDVVVFEVAFAGLDEEYASPTPRTLVLVFCKGRHLREVTAVWDSVSTRAIIFSDLAKGYFLYWRRGASCRCYSRWQ